METKTFNITMLSIPRLFNNSFDWTPQKPDTGTAALLYYGGLTVYPPSASTVYGMEESQILTAIIELNRKWSLG